MFVEELASNTVVEEIYDVFSRFGRVMDVHFLMRHKKHRGFCICEVSSTCEVVESARAV